MLLKLKQVKKKQRIRAMNKPDSYLDKARYYLAQMEIDFDVRLQKVQKGVEAFKVTLQSVVMEGELRAIRTGFYPTAEQGLLNRYSL